MRYVLALALLIVGIGCSPQYATRNDLQPTIDRAGRVLNTQQAIIQEQAQIIKEMMAHPCEENRVIETHRARLSKLSDDVKSEAKTQ